VHIIGIGDIQGVEVDPGPPHTGDQPELREPPTALLMTSLDYVCQVVS